MLPFSLKQMKSFYFLKTLDAFESQKLFHSVTFFFLLMYFPKGATTIIHPKAPESVIITS